MQNPNYVQYPRFPEKRVRFEALNEAFSHFGKDWQLYVVAALPILLLTLPFQAYSFFLSFSNAGQQPTPEQSLAQLGISLWVNAITYVGLGGLVQLAVMRLDGKAVGAMDGYAKLRFGPLLISMLLIGILSVVGCCLCILPMFLVFGLFLVTFPLISDRKMGPLEAMGASFEAVKPHMWPATGLYFVASLVYGFSYLLCGVGMLAGLSIMALTIAITYRDLFPLDPQTFAPPVGTV